MDINKYMQILYELNNYKKNVYNMNIESIYVLKICNKIISTAKLFIEKKYMNQ